MTLVTLGDVEELVDSNYSGFDYPANRSMSPLLENEVGSVGNVVIQEGSTGYRQATISLLVESTVDVELIRGYKDAGAATAFIDRSGLERSVVVYAFSSSARPGDDAWDVTLTLLELTGPVAPGS